MNGAGFGLDILSLKNPCCINFNAVVFNEQGLSIKRMFVRAKIASLDYSSAEKRCPQKMTIGNLMRDAFKELA
jgi:hypothetical protein